MEEGFLKTTNVTSSIPSSAHPETVAESVIRVRGDPGYLCTTGKPFGFPFLLATTSFCAVGYRIRSSFLFVFSTASFLTHSTFYNITIFLYIELYSIFTSHSFIPVMLAECAIGLLDTSKLTPLARQGGVLTSVTAFGDELVKRLETTGRFEFETKIIHS